MPTEVIMPKMGLNMKEGVLADWLVEDGRGVHRGQPIFVVETDKIVNDIEAEADGILRRVARVGDSIPVTGLVGYILAEGEEMPQPEGYAEEGAGALAATPHEAKSSVGRSTARREEVPALPTARVRATPAARRLARQMGIDLAAITPADPQGRISRADVERAVEARADVAAQSVGEEVARSADVTPLTGARAVIARRMQLSSQQTAAVTLSTEIDATDLVHVRAQINEQQEGVKGTTVSYNAILVRLVAIALSKLPYMNASPMEGSVHYKTEVNVGVTVDSERGLLVPVIRNADSKSITQINRELGQLVERAIAGKSLLDDLTGGTFTITNMGSLGIDALTPLINPPEAAILGVGSIMPTPVVVDGEICVRDRVVLSLTFDHRLIDGAPAARFLQRIGSMIETLRIGSGLW